MGFEYYFLELSCSMIIPDISVLPGRKRIYIVSPLYRMLVYHFLNAKYGLEDIKFRRLRISRLMELNDPFEFLGVDLSDREFRQALMKTKAELSESKGVLCFSAYWRNPVLWAHYADKHKGLCLGFEVYDSVLAKVQYRDKRFPVPEKIDEEFMRKLLFLKFKHWEYEHEYRVFTQLEKHIDDIYYSEFSEQMQLRQIIVGERSSVTRAQVLDALGELESEVEAFKASAAFTKFEIVRQQNDAKWS
jgi:hypothetical protein